MTTVERGDPPAWLDEARPRLRPAVRVGPPLHQGPDVVHFVTDSATQSYFKVGSKEAFLIAQLDGSRSLSQIGVAYGRRFGMRLGAQNWQQLLALLSSRGLLEPMTRADLDERRARAVALRRQAGRGPLLWRVPWPGLAERLVPVARYSSWLLYPWLMLPLATLGLTVCAMVVRSWAILYAAMMGPDFSWSVAVAAVLVTWAVLGAHEIGHGVACIRYGGRPLEIGMMWRFPLLAPYCKVDDVVTFPRAGQRVTTSFAGVYVNLLAMLAFALLWQLGPATGWWHALAASLLFFGALSALVNLVPVFQLDGYRMIEHATSTINLQSSSLELCWRLVRGGTSAGYPPRLVGIFTGYALMFSAIVGSGSFLVVRIWWQTLARYRGGVFATVFLLIELAVLVALVGWGMRWRSRRRAGSA